jgi:hypothetical protein
MRLFWLLSAAILCSLPAHADPARDALSEVAKCGDIAAATERLACFDAAATAAKAALAAQPVQEAAGRTDSEKESGVLSWFGFSNSEDQPVTKPEEFGKPPVRIAAGPAGITEISADVMEFSKNALGRAIFMLDNGQVWRQIDGDTSEVMYPKANGVMKVTVREASFGGGYVLVIDGRTRTVKVRRLK